MERNLQKRISKLIGEPINPSLPVPVEVQEIADVSFADPGDKVWRYDGYDTDADQILDVDTTNANLTTVKRAPESEVELTFKHLNSKLEYVHVEDVMDNADQNVLARKQRGIARGLDKLEIRIIFYAITQGISPGLVGGTHSMEDSVQSVTLESGDDLYDIILKAKHKVEDYGDGYKLFVGNTVKEKIDTFDKDKASTFNYNVTLTQKLSELGIKPFKIFGQVKWTGGEHNIGSAGVGDDSSATNLLSANKFVFEAVNSRIGENAGKPVKFVRRRISRDIAEFMGADVDKAQRATIVANTPVPVGSNQKLAYGVYAYESLIWCITNAYALCNSGDISSYL